uniref:Uncharacterized protein n=1 Tax=Arundo donax TaxID=35708 RepID=A0A0A9HAA0_ARUDO
MYASRCRSSASSCHSSM